MRESRSYGSVRERGGNKPLYSEELRKIKFMLVKFTSNSMHCTKVSKMEAS